MMDDYWKVNYRTATLGDTYVFISADYKQYDAAKVIEVLSEVHPDWQDIQPAVHIPMKYFKEIVYK